MNTLASRIIASHEIMLGKPIIRGTRLTVELLLRKMSEGATAADLLAMYPQLAMADVEAVANRLTEPHPLAPSPKERGD